ncbi:MAG TPA: hypothetical protein VJK03_03550 [Candidatus Nanoarchaeia archaeon]|nr:hypothetical protein [Candidatus Nanoarchaeia archaeon]
MMEKRTLYFGPPHGVYSPESFDNFAHKIFEHLRNIGSASPCNVERNGEIIEYHFPEAGIGLRYERVSHSRCMVNLLGTREKELEAITLFVFEEDNRQ